MTYMTEITRERIPEYLHNEKELIKEMREKGFQLVDKRPCERFGLEDLYWYYFDKKERKEVNLKNKFRNLNEK